MKLAEKVVSRYVKERVEIPIPLVQQETDFSCGSAALCAILQHFVPGQAPKNEEDLWEALGTTEENGTEPPAIVRVAQEYGLKARFVQNMTLADMRAHLDAKEAVILCFQAWPNEKPVDYPNDWADGHYTVLIGMDNERLYVMDPSTEGDYGWIYLKDFPGRWHDVDRGTPRYGIGIVIGV